MYVPARSACDGSCMRACLAFFRDGITQIPPQQQRAVAVPTAPAEVLTRHPWKGAVR